MNNDQFRNFLGEAFKKRRQRLHLTHENVAERADINVNYYARIERGEINTTLDKIMAISKALEAKPSKLFVQAEKLSEQ